MITDTTYKVDKENKVVICELKCDLQLEKHPAWLVISPSMWKKKFPNISWDSAFTVRAKARCNNLDTFDEKKGKMIAESRAKLKMYSIAERLYSCVSDTLEDLDRKVVNSIAACATEKQCEEMHIKELTK